VYNCLDV
jgi:hypothetical protein